MARIIDFIDHQNVMDDELSYREPQGGNGDFRMGSVVSVQENQAAVFVSRGRVMDVFGPGQHILSTANLPLMSNLWNIVTNGRNPFTAEVYFINMKPLPNVRWGTNPPIELSTPDGLGKMLLMGNGVAELRVTNPNMFMQYVVGKPMYRLEDFRDNIQAMLVGQLTTFLSKNNIDSPQRANALMSELEGAVLATLNEGFARMGISVTAFEANPFQRKQISTQEAAELFGTWEQRMQKEQMEVMKTAAANEGTLGGTMGAGFGMGIGQQLGANMNPQQAQQQMLQQQMMMQQMQQMMNQMQQQQAPAAPVPAAAPATPQTPQQIEQMLDSLDMRFANGEISESAYNTMKAKWEARLNELRGS
jgi:membrane protease subunit (stomatin/prohibitin family)